MLKITSIMKSLALVLSLWVTTSNAESFYTYRLTGECGVRVTNQNIFPNRHLSGCYDVLVTKLELKVFPEMQRVVVQEEEINSYAGEYWWASPQSMVGCSVIDKDNFACRGLVRVNGKFTNSESINLRVISSSYFNRAYAVVFEKITNSFFNDLEDTSGVLIFILVGLCIIYPTARDIIHINDDKAKEKIAKLFSKMRSRL